jgi:ATP phosphoribosyltransferase
MGIAGKDILLEHGAESLYEPLDLGIAKCRLMTAAHKDAPVPKGRLRVATKYVNIAQSYFANQGIQAEIIKLYGSMELAPLVGLADCIVDLVDTGNTLRANNLEPRELIMNISSRLVVNKAAMKMKNQAIATLLEQLEKALTKR